MLDFTNPPTPFNHPCKFDEGEEFESVSEFDEHHEFNESEDICVRVVEPTNLQFDNDNFSVEYESFSCGFDVNEGLNVDTCVEYNSFSFDPVITNHLFEPPKSKFLEFKTFVPMTANLD